MPFGPLRIPGRPPLSSSVFQKLLKVYSGAPLGVPPRKSVIILKNSLAPTPLQAERNPIALRLRLSPPARRNPTSDRGRECQYHEEQRQLRYRSSVLRASEHDQDVRRYRRGQSEFLDRNRQKDRQEAVPRQRTYHAVLPRDVAVVLACILDCPPTSREAFRSPLVASWVP